MSKNVTFWFKLQNMAQEELLEHVPPEELKEIQENHERVEAYVIAHEGTSKTNVVNEGNKFLNWFGKVIDKIVGSTPPGTPVFHLHNSDNSTTGREKIGKVIKTIKNAAGEAVAIIRRFKKWLNLDTDVASFEAPLAKNTPDLNGHYVQPWELGDITGIALGSSAKCKQAFPGAMIKAYVQCFEKQENKNMDLSEIFAYIEENKIEPLRLFPRETILNLEFVKDAIAEKKGNENQQATIMRLREEKIVLQEKHKKEMAALNEDLSNKNKELLDYQVKEGYESELKSRTALTPDQLQFLEMQRKHLDIDPEQDIDAQIKAHLDKSIDTFSHWKNIFVPENKQDDKKENEFEPVPGPPKTSDIQAILDVIPD